MSNNLPAGERPSTDQESPKRVMNLASGKLFAYGRPPGQDIRKQQSYTSADGGKTWDDGGEFALQALGGALENVAIQIQSGPHTGRIVIPYYFEMDGDHLDYSRVQRGGYAMYKGEVVPVETHTHVPEMAGTFMNLSDDDGKTWQASKGFLMGYFEDGHLGHWSCEEPVVAELKDGRLLCYMRATTGRILKSYSSDGGESWTKVESTELAMSNSPCVLKRIPGTDDLMLLWNQMSAEEIKGGYRRGRLCVAVSKDDGQTWEAVKTIELCEGCKPMDWVEPPPLQAMVRGGCGPDDLMPELPEGFRHYHYPEVYFAEKENTVRMWYLVSAIGGPPPDGITSKWRVFPIDWLYEEAATAPGRRRS